MSRRDLRTGERAWRDTRPVQFAGEVMNPAWRKPQRLTLWERLVRRLNAP